MLHFGFTKGYDLTDGASDLTDFFGRVDFWGWK
ncbi:hypothetical protein GGE08_000489 [Muricauda sp. ARW1Y1]|jgi:hypothetical protein|nr:hypothetical protein [Muricauda sp. ARW1Y1]